MAVTVAGRTIRSVGFPAARRLARTLPDAMALPPTRRHPEWLNYERRRTTRGVLVVAAAVGVRAQESVKGDFHEPPARSPVPVVALTLRLGRWRDVSFVPGGTNVFAARFRVLQPKTFLRNSPVLPVIHQSIDASLAGSKKVSNIACLTSD